MRNFNFYRTAALAVGAMLAASVAVISCKKDETTPAPITTETLKQLNELMREGYYGAVKSVTNTTYTNLKPTVPDSLDVDISAARPTQETKTEYNTAGYKTLKTVRRADYARNPTTGEYEYGELKPTEKNFRFVPSLKMELLSLAWEIAESGMRIVVYTI
jgi:hypothetical protein